MLDLNMSIRESLIFDFVFPEASLRESLCDKDSPVCYFAIILFKDSINKKKQLIYFFIVKDSNRKDSIKLAYISKRYFPRNLGGLYQ